MYSYEQRKKAVELYFQYDHSLRAVQVELGYPNSVKSIRNWVNEFQHDEDLHRNMVRSCKYSEEQRKKAVEYYLEHGKNVNRTCRILGYPSRTLLTQWIIEDVPQEQHNCRKGSPLVKYCKEDKEAAVLEMCSSTSAVQSIADELGVSRAALYDWKSRLLRKGDEHSMAKKRKTVDNNKTIEELTSERDQLTSKVNELQQQIYRLQLEKDVLEKAAEIIKKDQGISLIKLTNKEKAIVIDALREKYTVKELLSVFHMAKSSYCYQSSAIKKPDKYKKEREAIRKSFSDSKGAYGYRRIHCEITADGSVISEKVVRRLMKEEKLIVKSIRKKKYNSYMGEISPAVKNIISRDFHAEKPNVKWLTDITEFHIPAGKIYLSPIIDCFDGLPVSWTIGKHPDAELVNTMLDMAISTLKSDEKPIVHSDRGAHYRWPGWIERMENAGLTRSMSKKGCSPDNSACEGFFGRLKNEMFYGRCWDNVSIDQFITELDDYIHWYAENRIKISLGGMSPIQYRKRLGLIAA
ncbi:IS3 family transposase [Lachnospiraceae bacterium C1.1]|nr:IS3 family transposase [Lachnospiraceae bacterium C1.1]